MAADTGLSEAWMREALEAARNGWGETHPNPNVGAILVEGGKVVARGWHERAGGPHAEINALRALGRRPAPGATLVVTLEPCSTRGRTGACTEAVLEAGIRNVIVGATDPFPAHAGRGFDILRRAGVNLATGVLGPLCEDLNLIFNHRVTHDGAVFVALKTAASLDGKIATACGESQWITGDGARANVMHWRRYFPAIATSASTALADDPRLTSRRDKHPEHSPRARFVFDRRLRLAEPATLAKLRLFNDEFAAKTILVTTRTPSVPGHASISAPTSPDNVPRAADADSRRDAALAALAAHGIQVWDLRVPDERSFFGAFKARCAAEGLDGVYVEGGGNFLGAWLRAGAADYIFHYAAPGIFASSAAIPAYAGLPPLSLPAIPRLENVRHESFGGDILVRGAIAGFSGI
jgi:diaminohydroxyphosphoribosylaminopyrimidine deaminase/5-amino-6-(5-phosphoribosylamino)uracil reductase